MKAQPSGVALFFCALLLATAADVTARASEEASLALARPREGGPAAANSSAPSLLTVPRAWAARDGELAAAARAQLRDPGGIGSSLQCGLQAICAAVERFSADPPQVRDGILALGRKLFECFQGLLGTEALAGLGDVDAMRKVWLADFENFEASSESVFSDIGVFVESGESAPLLRAVASIFGDASTIVAALLPADISSEIVKYLGAVEDAFESVAVGWDEFAKGKTVEGMQAVYLGLRRTTDGLLPDSLKNDETFGTVIGMLDTVVGDLSKTVLEYERRIKSSNVCWRVEKRRERIRPRLCPDGYHWDGVAFCYPLIGLMDAGASAAIAQARTLDASVALKGDAFHQPELGAIPARCDYEGRFSEKHGQFCYEPCIGGFRAKSHDRCVSSCEGKFPVESLLLCARDQGVLTKTILEMATTAVNAVVTLAGAASKLFELGTNPNALTTTMKVFVDLGKPFANPICPSRTPVPTPVPAPTPEMASAGRRRRSKQMECKTGVPVYFMSHRGTYLRDNHGRLDLSRNRLEWERWILTDASAAGTFFITGHRNESIIDYEGKVGLSPNKLDWEEWKIVDAADGLVFLVSHRHQQLQDHYGKVRLAWSALAWEKWSALTEDGSPACLRAPADASS